VVKGLEAAHRAGIALSARLTLTARFAPTWLVHVAHVLSLGVNFESVQVEFVNKAGPFGLPGLEVPLDVRKTALDDYAAFLLAYQRENGALPSVFVSPFPVAYETLTAPQYSWRSCAAATSRICVGADGTVYPCVAFSDTPRASLGKVTDPPEGLSGFRVPAVGEIPKCENCFLKYACLGGCFQDMCAANPLLPLPLPDNDGPFGSSQLDPPEEYCQLLRHAYRKAIVVLCTVGKRSLPAAG
jgi:radical SAM protein with 4Fe4S-binding SPASM domain